MKLGKYEVNIFGGNETGDGYVQMSHDTQYKIHLSNGNWDRRCDVELKIDGKPMGKFRIEVGGSVVLERPPHDKGKFTFYKDGTAEAKAANVSEISREYRGLVEATFLPEKEPVKHIYSSDSNESYPIACAGFGDGHEYTSYRHTSDLKAKSRGPSGQSVTSGGTGLSGQSSQRFQTVTDLDYDHNAAVTINLRLVAKVDGPRPLTSVPNSTPVPRPV